MVSGNIIKVSEQQIAALPNSATSAFRQRGAATRVARHPLGVGMAVTVAALALLLPGIGRPRSAYFDELYFVPEARALIQGVPNPAPYVPSLAKPPLGKIVMAIGMEIGGDNSFGWRVAGGVCGALTVGSVYLWTYLLLGDAGLAALAAMLALLNNFLFVMSRIATVDVFLMFFLMWSLVAYTASLTLDIGVGLRRLLFCASGVLVGLAGACKWNAIDTLAVYSLVTIILFWFSRTAADSASAVSGYGRSIRQIGLPVVFGALIVAPVMAYSLCFWPMCRVLHLPFNPREVGAINAFMWHFNKTTAINPFITMPWYSWPFNLQPLRALSYLVGNPVVTWGGLIALALCIYRFCKKITFPEGLVILLFAVNFLQWPFTPQKGLYYYYYYPCVMVLGVVVAVALRALPARLFGLRPALPIVLLAAVVFIFCYPHMAHLEAPWDCALGCFP